MNLAHHLIGTLRKWGPLGHLIVMVCDGIRGADGSFLIEGKEACHMAPIAKLTELGGVSDFVVGNFLIFAPNLFM
jgi:hypothetical protein